MVEAKVEVVGQEDLRLPEGHQEGHQEVRLEDRVRPALAVPLLVVPHQVVQPVVLGAAQDLLHRKLNDLRNESSKVTTY